MSDRDSFIDEVSEEVRRDRFYGFLRRYGWLAGTLVALVIGAAAVNEWQKARAEARAKEAGDEIAAALDNATAATRLATLADIEADDLRGAIVRLLTAAAALEAGETGQARRSLSALAQDGGQPELYRELATLKESLIASGEMPPDERIAMLEPLTQPGAPYRFLAIEQIALAELAAGRADDARARIDDLLRQSGVPEGLRQRAAELTTILGGSGEPS